MTKYLTRDIFEQEPQWAEPVLQTLDWPVDVIEALGISYGETDYEEPALREKFKYVDAERSNVKAVIDFFNTKKGRYDYFWVPTWSSDIVVTAAFDTDAVQLTIQDIDYAETYLENDVTGRHVFILFPDGTSVCRKIIAAPTGTTITLDSAIGKAISSDDLPQLLVSFLNFSRFDADEVKVDYSNLDTASINLSFKAIPTESGTTTSTTTTTTTTSTSTITATTTTIPYMSGWDNRIKLTIDHTKVDSALEYFPVLIHLSNSSGITDQDVRFIFDEVGANSKKIAITTEDGLTKLFVEIERWDETNNEAWMWVRIPSISAPTDTILWLYYDNDVADQDVRTLAEAGDTFTGTNGDLPNQELWRNALGSPTIQSNKARIRIFGNVQEAIAARFNVAGDFDIQVDYELDSAPSTDSWFLALRIYIDSSNRMSIGRVCDTGTSQRYIRVQKIGGSQVNVYSSTTTDLSGKLRITRTGTTWHAYYWNDPSWVEVGTGSAIGSGEITYVELRASNWDSAPDFTGYMDNFIINSAGSITGFVDDTLGKPAQEVWDGNFKLVCHMAQDPNGDVADAIKDSTRNGLHGTPDGTMLTADLVDGKVGKAIDFDGTDDEVGFAQDAFSGVQGTIEGCINFVDLAQIQTLFSASDITENNNYLKLEVDSVDGKFRFQHTSSNVVKGDTVLLQDTFYHIVAISNSSAWTLYINNILQSLSVTGVNNGDWFDDLPAGTYDNWIGRWERLASSRTFKGVLDEVRISNVARSVSWIKATYNSLWDSLITFESAPASTTTTTTTTTTTV